MSVRLLVVDHRPHERNLLERRLSAVPGFEVVAQWLNSSDIVRMVDQHQPDVLLLDLDLPADHGFAALKQLSAAPRLSILGMTAERRDHTVLRVLDLGGSGVVARDAPHHVLVRSIRVVADGGYWVEAEDVPALIATMRLRKSALPAAAGSADGVSDAKKFRLTPRELDIVAAVAIGASNKEIANRLSVAECTVKHHLSSVYGKVGVFSRLELALFAIHHHLVQIAEGTHFLP